MWKGRRLSPGTNVESAGGIPRGWTKGLLQDLAEYFVGGDWGADSAVEDGMLPASCIRGADIPDLQAAGTGKMPTRFLKSTSLEKRALKAGDLVIEVSGGSPTQSTGRPILVTHGLLERLTLPLVCSNFCRMLRLKEEHFSKFVYFWLLDLYGRGEFLKFETGTTGIKNLVFTKFAASFPLIIPPASVLKEFESLVGPLIEMQQRNGAESQTLATLRDTLLPKLLSGEIRVKQAEKMVERWCKDASPPPRTLARLSGRGDGIARSARALPARWAGALLGSVGWQPVILVVAANPEPDKPFVAVSGQRSIAEPDSYRPDLGAFELFQAERWVPGVRLQERKVLVCQLANLGRQLPIVHPE